MYVTAPLSPLVRAGGAQPIDPEGADGLMRRIESYDFVWTPSQPGDAELLVHFPFATEPGEILLRQPLRVR